MKCFSRSNDFKPHLVTYTQDKLFKCDFRDKSFTRKGDVKIYMLVYNGIKEFQCEVFEVKFSQTVF